MAYTVEQLANELELARVRLDKAFPKVTVLASVYPGTPETENSPLVFIEIATPDWRRELAFMLYDIAACKVPLGERISEQMLRIPGFSLVK